MSVQIALAVLTLLVCAIGVGGVTLALLGFSSEYEGEQTTLSFAAGPGVMSILLGVLGLFCVSDGPDR